MPAIDWAKVAPTPADEITRTPTGFVIRTDVGKIRAAAILRDAQQAELRAAAPIHAPGQGSLDLGGLLPNRASVDTLGFGK